MANTLTTLLKLFKATPGSNEQFRTTDINSNWDKIDQNIGAFICTSTTRPATPFDTQLIRETDTKQLRRWDAASNEWRWESGPVHCEWAGSIANLNSGVQSELGPLVLDAAVTLPGAHGVISPGNGQLTIPADPQTAQLWAVKFIAASPNALAGRSFVQIQKADNTVVARDSIDAGEDTGITSDPGLYIPKNTAMSLKFNVFQSSGSAKNFSGRITLTRLK